MVALKLVVIVFLVLVLLIPALFLAFLFFTQVIVRIFIKILGLRIVAPPMLGPFLDSDFRRAFQRPETIIERSGIREGMRVLEVGCGSGAYTTYVARKVGPSGMEYALDVQEEMLEQLEEKLAREENRDIRNVALVESDAYHMSFEDNFFDLVFMVSVLQQIVRKEEALGEIKRVLKPGGTLAVTEIVVDPYYSFRAATLRLGVKAGFTPDTVQGNFWHYTARFVKNNEKNGHEQGRKSEYEN